MTNTPIHQDLLMKIAEFCDRHGIAATTFGSAVLRDPSFVRDLENGRECRRSTVTKVEAAIANPALLFPQLEQRR